MRLSILVAAALLATHGFAQDNFPELPTIRLGAVQKDADLFKNHGMDIRLPNIGRPDELVEKPYWTYLTFHIARQLPEFFRARAKKHRSALEEWWKLYVCDDPVRDVKAELEFLDGGWKHAIESLVAETCDTPEAQAVRKLVAQAEVAAQLDLEVVTEIARHTDWVYDEPDYHWMYLVVEEAMKSGLVRLYPNRLIRGAMPYTRKDFAYIVVNVCENLSDSIEGERKLADRGGFQGRTGLSQGLLKLSAEVQPEMQKIRRDPSCIRKDFTRLSAWLDRGRWSDKLNRAYLSETPPGHWADAAMTGLYEAGILIGREVRPIQPKR